MISLSAKPVCIYSLRFVNVKITRQSQEILKIHKLNFVTGYFYSASMNLFINVENLFSFLILDSLVDPVVTRHSMEEKNPPKCTCHRL